MRGIFLRSENPQLSPVDRKYLIIKGREMNVRWALPLSEIEGIQTIRVLIRCGSYR